MEEADYEKIFTLNKTNGKYKRHLTQAIQFLLSKQRVIEAKYHFMNLEKIKPDHILVMRLGFDIGIKNFDFEMVQKYSDLMNKSKKISQKELAFKTMYFYISINDETNAEETIHYLLDACDLNNKELLRLYHVLNQEINKENLHDKFNLLLKKKNLKIEKNESS